MSTVNPIGYCAVIVPKLDYWQGLFINETSAGNRLIDKTMELLQLNPEKDNRQELLDVFTGTLVHCVMETDLQTKAGPLIEAVSQLIDSRYFYLTADHEQRGIRSEIQLLDAKSIDEAREQIETLPVVMEIKHRLLKHVLKKLARH